MRPIFPASFAFLCFDIHVFAYKGLAPIFHQAWLVESPRARDTELTNKTLLLKLTSTGWLEFPAKGVGVFTLDSVLTYLSTHTQRGSKGLLFITIENNFISYACFPVIFCTFTLL